MCDPEFRARARRARLHPRRGAARSSSSRRTPGGSANAPRRSSRNVDRYEADVARRAPRPGARPASCAVPGTDARGRRRGPTRSSRRTAPSWSRRGTGSCTTSGSRPPNPSAANCRDSVATIGSIRRDAAVELILTSPRRQAVGMERRRHPRRSRAARRLRRHRSPSVPVRARAGRGPHRPCRHHVRARCWTATTYLSTSARLTSQHVLAVEADLVDRLAGRADEPDRSGPPRPAPSTTSTPPSSGSSPRLPATPASW